MPKGSPPAHLLTSRRLQAFTLDTSVVESTGFRFESGPIKHLSSQLPPWMQLWMPEVIIREINARRNSHVARSIQTIKSGLQDLRRHIGSDLTTGNVKWLDGAPHIARESFDNQMERFIKSHSGIVIELTHPLLAKLTFDRYFEQLPPFENSKDKKSEFPDATALISLELKANDLDCDLLVVSQDVGWASFAETSKRIYCVSDIQSLAALYISTSPLAKSLRGSMERTLEAPSLSLKKRVFDVVQRGLHDLHWHVRTPRSYRLGIDAGILDAKLISVSPNPAAVGVWITSTDEKSGVIEIGVDVSLTLTIEAVAFEELISGEKLDVAHTEVDIDYEGEVKIVLEMQGNLTSSDLWKNVTNLELRPDSMVVKLDEIDFGGKVGVIPRKSQWWDSSPADWDDDIPF